MAASFLPGRLAEKITKTTAIRPGRAVLPLFQVVSGASVTYVGYHTIRSMGNPISTSSSLTSS